MEVNWCLPLFNDVDSRSAAPTVTPTLDYLAEVARAADECGYHAILVGAGFAERYEAFLAASAIMAATRRLRALVATRPGFYSAPVAAKLAATLDQQSAGRMLLNVVSGGVPSDLSSYGDTLPHDERYLRTEEFVRLVRLLWDHAGEPVDFSGRYYSATRSVLPAPLVGSTANRIYLGGSSPAAKRVAAQWADTYLMFGEPLDRVRRELREVTTLADKHDRTIRCGIRINVIARRSSGEAWEWANTMASTAPAGTRERINAIATETDSVAQRRMFALRDQTFGQEPWLWTGLGHLRVGAATAVVGSYREVREALLRYRDTGVDVFILAGFPHLDECRRFGCDVLPLLE